jgi:hypothetical protein
LEIRRVGKGVPVYYLPWWALFACMPASALATYLALRDSALSRRALFVLTAVLAPLVLLGAAVAALAVSDHPVPVTTAPTASPTASPSATASSSARAPR